MCCGTLPGTAMDEPPNKPHGIGWYAAWIVLALVVYVASVGPAGCALMMIEAPEWVNSTFEVVYYPLVASERAADISERYMFWWVALVTGEPVPATP